MLSLRLMSSFLLLPLLAACSSVPDEAPPAAEASVVIEPAPSVSGWHGVSRLAPPPAPQEYPPMLDRPDLQVWQPGAWAWNGVDYIWVPGVVAERPEPTAVWREPQWVRRAYGWALIPGYWE